MIDLATIETIAAAIPWLKIEELGENLYGKIVAYIAASKAKDAAAMAKLRGEEDAIANEYYDRIDNHLLDHNKLIDAEADAKFKDGV